MVLLKQCFPTQTEQGIVLGAFFWGYAATQLLGGQAADRLGGQHVLGLGVFVWSACTFLTPAAALAGFGVLLVARVALGLGEGIAFPAVHTLIGAQVNMVCTHKVDHARTRLISHALAQL